jgi:hypothetical protein
MSVNKRKLVSGCCLLFYTICLCLMTSYCISIVILKVQLSEQHMDICDPSEERAVTILKVELYVSN